MQPYAWSVLGVLLFVGFFGISNLFMKAKCRMSYAGRPWCFSLFFLVPNGLILLLVSDVYDRHMTISTLAAVSYSVLVYASFCEVWRRYGGCELDGHYLFKVPLSHENMMLLSWQSGLVKIQEIVFQQLCALLVIKGLFSFGLSALVTSVVFTFIVYIVHMPSVRYFGPLFGRFFILSSSGLAVIYPFIIVVESGFGIMVLLHTASYLVLYGFLARYCGLPRDS